MPTRDPFSAEELYRWIECQTNLGARRPGSPADLANEDFIFSQLKKFGLSNVRREPVPVTHWDSQVAGLHVAHESFSVFAIPHTAFSAEGGNEAPLIHVNADSFFGRANWRGKIVVADLAFPPLDASLLLRLALGKYDPDDTLKQVNHPATWIRLGWHLYRWAYESGAVGFVGILKDQPGGTARMYAPYGFKEKDILDKPLAGVWAGRNDRARLVELAKAGAKARLVSGGTHLPAPSHNIVGEIPGEGDEEAIVLTTHHDSPFVSPVEDASGVAVVLALARYFAERKPLRRRLVVLFSSGHFYGSIGTRTFIATHRDLVARTALEISIEHIALEAVEDSAGELVASGLPEPVALFVSFNRAICDGLKRGLEKHRMDRVLLLPAEGPLGEYPPTDGGDWYEAGVPMVNYISNPVYNLTDDDAHKWVDKTRLTVAGEFFADFIERMDKVPREQLARVDFPLRLGLMKALKHLVRLRTTCFGLKPLH